MEKVKHFLKLNDFVSEELSYIFDRAKVIKANFRSYKKTWTLEDRTLVMIFEKASTRTRLSFEAGMNQMGGNACLFKYKRLAIREVSLLRMPLKLFQECLM